MYNYEKQNKALIFLCIGGYLLLIFCLTCIHVFVFSMLVDLSRALLNFILCIGIISVTLAYIFGFIFRGMYKSNIDTAINQMGESQKTLLGLQLLGKKAQVTQYVEKHNKDIKE